jgi:uncharacterized damage-inducible protein DinB
VPARGEAHEPHSILTLYQYNDWMQVRVLRQAGLVTPAQYTAPASMPHSRRRGTLVHGLVAEVLWRRRWHGASPSALPMEAHRNLMHQPQLAEFAQAIQERRQPAITVSDGRRVLKVLDAFIRSERTGQPARI